VEAWLVALGASLALGAVTLAALRDRRIMARIAAAAGVESAAEVPAAVRSSRERADRLETSLASVRADHDAFVESMTQGVLVVGPDLRITAANGAAYELLDRAPLSLVGRSIIETFIDTNVEATVRSARDAGSATIEYAPTGADGRRLLIRARRSPDGGSWMLLEDIAELRRLQQIRTEFIDNLSHELRTPLTTVSLLAETLAREADAAGDTVPPRMRERIGKIEVETGHLVQMVSELVDLSRIESGGGLGPVELLDIGAIATTSTERLRLFAERQGVGLRVEVAERVPLVQGDAARLGQVLVNLVHNAVKFSPDGGDVTVRVRAGDAEVVTEVADHGIGIAPVAQARIFERFYKVDRARVRGESGGTGLGLAIARHIVEQHGGRIWVESAEGVGSTFSFALPIAGPPTIPARRATSEDPAAS